jgi:hypothetical protein
VTQLIFGSNHWQHKHSHSVCLSFLFITTKESQREKWISIGMPFRHLGKRFYFGCPPLVVENKLASVINQQGANDVKPQHS